MYTIHDCRFYVPCLCPEVRWKVVVRQVYMDDGLQGYCTMGINSRMFFQAKLITHMMKTYLDLTPNNENEYLQERIHACHGEGDG